MKPIAQILIVTISCFSTLCAQGSGIAWTEVSDASLPVSVKLYRGERASPLLKAWYIDVNMDDTTIAIRPYVSNAPAGKEGVAPFVQRVGAYAGINGGYFDINSSTSYSAVVYPNEVRAQNIDVITRSGVPYPVTRSFFGVTYQRQMAVDWIYHFGNGVSDILRFSQPTLNSPGSPAPVPNSVKGLRYTNLLVGIGGGPTLVKNDTVNVTYNPEVFWGSGVGELNADPRTAVGYTANHHAVLLVADGRSGLWSVGVSLPELAQIMVELKCVEAMNLDGGGSTQMAVGGTLINRPEGGTNMRPVPTVLAVVRADSLALPRRVSFEKVIDTGDPECSLVGAGWFASANSGYWGSTRAMLNPKGSGNAYAVFRPGLAKSATYDVFAWWVADPNRCSDTPFFVKHKYGRDTIRVNQTTNGSQWYRIGSFSFNGDSTETVGISNAATNGSYIVADAVRIISYDPAAATAVNPLEASFQPSEFELYQNYPNPFNPSTTIKYRISKREFVTLRVFDLLGRRVTTLVEQVEEPGSHTIAWDSRDLATGVYIYRIVAGAYSQARKLVVLR